MNNLFVLLLFLWVTGMHSNMAQSSISSAGGGCTLDFNGSGNYVEIPSSQGLNAVANTGASATYEAWVRWVNPGSNEVVLSKMHTSGDQALFDVGITSAGLVYFLITNGFSMGTDKYTASVPLEQDKWVYIAVTHTYGLGSSTNIYINGLPVAGSWTMDGNRSVISNNMNPLHIGRQLHINPCFYNDEIDEVRIWNRALTQVEIRENMCRRLSGSEPGLMGYWCFDECSGSMAADLSGHGNNGVLH